MKRNSVSCLSLIKVLIFTILLFSFTFNSNAVSLNLGDIIATHYRTAEVFLVDPATGNLSIITSGDLLVEPSGVAIDLKGNILIADTQIGIILIDPETGQQTLLCSLIGAFGIAVDENGYIYVSTLVGSPPNSTASIIRIDPATGLPQLISENGNLLIPREIDIDDHGKIVVADQGIGYLDDGAILRIDPATGLQEVISSGGFIRTIRGLEIDGSGQFIVGENRSPAMVIRVDPATGIQSEISRENNLVSPVGIAIEEEGSILVADNGTGAPGDGAIIRINPQTGTQTLLISAATSNGMFTNGRGITVYKFKGLPVPTYSCSGFEPPFNNIITVKNKNRCIPLRTELFNADGLPITDADIMSPPIIDYAYLPNLPSPSDTTVFDGLPPAVATDGNEFVFEDGKWHFNIKIRDYYENAGTYTFMMKSGDESEYLIDSTNNTVTIAVEK